MPEPAVFDALLGVFAFAFGAVAGSFGNVCIHRFPRGESVVFPPSRCPGCGAGILPFDNVPVVSWLLLGGRCRACRCRISARYPIVEAACGLLFLAAFEAWGATATAASFSLLSFCALVLAATDLDARVLPDEVTLGGLAAGIALSALRPIPGADDASRVSSILLSAAGAATGAALLLGVRLAYRRLRGVEGMGLGDVKMIAMAGAFTGPAGVFATLFLASASGAVSGGLVVLGRRAAWRRARVLVSGDGAGGDLPGAGALVAPDGTLVASGRRWAEVPGAPLAGARADVGVGTARPLAAFVRLARRRAASGRATATSRLVLDDGDAFFRVLAARAEPRDGGLLVLLARADVPFGAFLAGGALLAFAFGRVLLTALLGADPPGAGLLP